MRRSVVGALGLTMLLIAGACSSGDDFHLGNALTLRRQVSNQTGRQDLSLADHLAVGIELCDGAVNDRARLLELSDDLGLGSYSSIDTGAAALWRGAYEVCPEVIDGDATTPPFDVAAAVGPRIVEVDGIPAAFPQDFADITLLDSQLVEWREGVEFGLYSTAPLEADVVLAALVESLPDGWTAGEMLGPARDIAGFDTWSVDVTGFGWSGTMDALAGPPGVFGEPDRETFVILVFVPA